MTEVAETHGETHIAEQSGVKNGLTLRPITAAEYQRMTELGIFGEDERVELIEGRIVSMAPKNVLHALATTRSNRCFSRQLGDHVLVRIQDPILLNDLSEPEPDITLIVPPDERYLDHHPRPDDIFLVLEIADSSLTYDRQEKCPLYGRNGIMQFCLLNLRDRELEDYRQPGRNGYRSKQTYSENQSFTLAAFPEVSICVSDLLPPRRPEGKRRKT